MFLSLLAAACALTIAYSFAIDNSSSRYDVVGEEEVGSQPGGRREGAIACCGCMSTTWEEWVSAGGAEGRK